LCRRYASMLSCRIRRKIFVLWSPALPFAYEEQERTLAGPAFEHSLKIWQTFCAVRNVLSAKTYTVQRQYENSSTFCACGWLGCRPSRDVTRGTWGHNSPGAESLRWTLKSLNNVRCAFFNTVNLLPKDLRFEHGGAKLAPGAIQPRYAPEAKPPLQWQKLTWCSANDSAAYTSHA